MIQIHADWCTCPTCQEWGRLEAITKSQISLRDFFAGCALMGILKGNPLDAMHSAAIVSFEYADVMMKTREQSAST